MIPMNAAANFPDLDKAVVMGILNITPDSFYDGGRYLRKEKWIKRVASMIDSGASIIDIGGASTRPGATEITPEEEWTRIAPVLESIVKTFPELCISVDTYYSYVADRSLQTGASMINDISGGTFDGHMAEIIGKYNVPFVIMHVQGRPGNMQHDPHYDDVVKEIYHFFQNRIKALHLQGADKLILDPGFGFGKTVAHNYQLLKNLSHFLDLGYPVMAGLSRKSMINRVLGIKPQEALNGTTVLNTLALQQGAKILRVHDVKEAMEAVKLWEQVC
jgi:dihydropteroate synthase